MTQRQIEEELEARDRVIDQLCDELSEKRRRAACLQEAIKVCGPGAPADLILFHANAYLFFLNGTTVPARAH